MHLVPMKVVNFTNHLSSQNNPFMPPPNSIKNRLDCIGHWAEQTFCLYSTYAILISMTSCGLSLELPTVQKPKQVAASPQEAPPAGVAPTSTTELQISRQIRRIKIELTGQLPSPSEIESLVSKPKNIPLWIDFLLEHHLSYEIFAENFASIWNFKKAHLYDLESIAETDPLLKKDLTESLKELMRNEPITSIKLLFEYDRPIKDLLDYSFSNVHKDLTNLYEITESTPTWPFSSYLTFRYNDQRPSAGLFSSNGFVAMFPSRGDPSGQYRVHQILRTIACDSMYNSKAHIFADLNEAELQGSLTDLSAQRPPCIGCHAPLQQIAPAFSGLGVGKTWKEWKMYQSPTEVPSGIYGQIEFKGLDDFGQKLGSSPQFLRCQIEKLSSLMLQMPYNALLRQSTALSYDSFVHENPNLRKSLRWLISSRLYNLAPTQIKASPEAKSPASPSATSTGTSTAASPKQTDPKSSTPGTPPPTAGAPESTVPIVRENQDTSGLRVLRKNHWELLLNSLLPQQNNLVFSEDLEPTYDEYRDFEDFSHIPNIRYIMAMESLVRKFSYNIIREELKEGVKAQDRTLLRELPDDFALTTTPEMISTQIKSLWLHLTSEKLDDRSQSLLDLTNLWNTVYSESGKQSKSPEPTLLAWQTMINVILTHPKFYSY